MLIFASASASATRANVPGRLSRKMASCLVICIIRLLKESCRKYHAIWCPPVILLRKPERLNDLGIGKLPVKNFSAGNNFGAIFGVNGLHGHTPSETRDDSPGHRGAHVDSRRNLAAPVV